MCSARWKWVGTGRIFLYDVLVGKNDDGKTTTSINRSPDETIFSIIKSRFSPCGLSFVAATSAIEKSSRWGKDLDVLYPLVVFTRLSCDIWVRCRSTLGPAEASR